MQESQVALNSSAVVRRWARHPRCVGLARAELRKAVADWGLAKIEDSALVVLSELVTNALQHARVPPGREIETRYVRLSRGLLIEVHDAADERPHRRASDLDSETGRGLALVSSLAHEWGVNERGGVGKAVWAVVATSDGDGDA
ncbi:ATP-binding protein [Streptomyces sp. NPDC047108]|uniref:ATP-binding protein n=1 Tax=Streptomyces sp. NPDC047108 TaxID=3155025 RepID=UPI0034011F84